MKSLMMALLVGASALANAAADKKTELPTKKITVEIKKAGARDALVALLVNSGVKYQLAEEINNDVKVDVEANKTKWSDVFSKVLSQAGLKYQMSDEGTLEISPEFTLNTEPTLEGLTEELEDPVLE